MKIDVLTTLPMMFEPIFSQSILGRAVHKGLVDIRVHDLRQWTRNQHKTTDDRPYGGGPGMVMMVEPIDRAVKELKGNDQKVKVVLTDARGNRFNQSKAKKWSGEKHLVFICGHYEGVDERVREYIADEVVSIGPFVMTGGEIAAMAMVDSVVRLLPGVFVKEGVTENESFSIEENGQSVLEYPQYTRPEKYRDWQVPKVLLSGNHAGIAQWRKEKQKKVAKQ